MQPVAGRPANDAAGEQVDDDGQVQPALLCPDVGDVGAPFFVRARRREILIKQVRRHRPGVVTVRGPLEPPLLPRPQPILTHQARRPTAANMQAIVAQVARHARAAVGTVRQCKGRPNMRQQHHVLVLAAAGRAPLPGEVATLTDAKDAAETVHGELLLRLVDELEAHRLPSLAKKAVARFRMSRSWRRISFSRRSRFNSAARSGGADPTGASAARSLLRPIQRTSVESPTPRSSAISRWVLPLVRTRRTASS